MCDNASPQQFQRRSYFAVRFLLDGFADKRTYQRLLGFINALKNLIHELDLGFSLDSCTFEDLILCYMKGDGGGGHSLTLAKDRDQQINESLGGKNPSKDSLICWFSSFTRVRLYPPLSSFIQKRIRKQKVQKYNRNSRFHS